jgi:hypothetical protein
VSRGQNEKSSVTNLRCEPQVEDHEKGRPDPLRDVDSRKVAIPGGAQSSHGPARKSKLCLAKSVQNKA